MASLMDSLANIPFYSAYTAKSQLNQQAGLDQIQQATGVVGLLEKLQAQQRDQQLRQTLQQTGGSASAAYQAALKAGNPEAAAKLAPLVKVEQDAEVAKQFSNIGSATPDQLDTLGQALAARGHPGAAAVMTIADKRRKQASDQTTLESMRDVPEGLAPGAAVPGTNATTTANIPPGDMAAFLKVAQATAQGKPATAAPQEGDPVAMGGGALAPLLTSQSPAIAARAKVLQGMINNPNIKPDVAAVQKQVDNLTAMDARFTESRQAAADRLAGRPSEPLVAVIQDGKPVLVPRSEAAYQTPAKEGATTPGGTLAGDALSMAVARYRTDGTFPPNMGRGAQGTANSVAILNGAAAAAAAEGKSGEAERISQLANKSIATALTGLERQRANVLTYEKTALAGADIAQEMSDKVDRTGVPLVNKWVNAGRMALQGDPDVTRLNNAVETFTNEYAKVMSGSSGGQATTVDMQKHARERLSAAFTKEQFTAAVDLLKREMVQTREKAFDSQIDEMKGRIGAGGATNIAPSGLSPEKERRYQELLRKKNAAQ